MGQARALGIIVVGLGLALFAPQRAWADEAPPADSAGEPAVKYHPIHGPSHVSLGHDLSLELPDGFLFLEKKEADALMKESGNDEDASLLGVAVKPNSSWLVTISYDAEGYIKDEDGEKLDAAEILQSITKGTEEANKYRTEHGFKPLHVDGWSELPHYERQTHHLIWAVRGSDADGTSVNYNTRVLGRHGYASLNLIDSPDRLPQSKGEVATLLGVTRFDSGARYEDFDVKRDKVAEYGLATLVAGGAGAVALKLAKVGLLAKFGGKILALLIAAKKALVALFIAAGAWLKKLFGAKKREPAPADDGPSQT